jgi:hypothetical protein
MAQQCTVATGQNRGKPAATPIDRPVAECVDAAMQEMESARLHPTPNRPHAQASSDQLSARDDAVLAASQRRQITLSLGELPPSIALTCL